jgi:hypothetical protein
MGVNEESVYLMHWNLGKKLSRKSSASKLQLCCGCDPKHISKAKSQFFF